MLLIYVLYCTLTVWLSVQAIIISVDRADDIKPRSTSSSMIENGWQPLTGYESIGNNVSPSNNAPHFILGKFQEHLIEAERAKPQQKNKSHDYGLPTILGSFSVFNHATTKARGKTKDHVKQIASETGEYSFLVPPPREAFRFKNDPQRKEILTSNESFLKQSTLITQNHPLSSFSPTNRSPIFFENKPLINGIGVRQTLQPPKHQAQLFDFQKDLNTRPFLQPPGVKVAVQFGKDNSETNLFDRLQPQSQSQVLNPATRNFFNQVKHPSPYRISFERDPAFLVHESHEISYVTPPTFGYNVRPTSLPYDNFLSHNVYSTTTASGTDSDKFHQLQTNNVPIGIFNQFEQIDKFPKRTVQPGSLSGNNVGTYFVSKYRNVLPPSSASYNSETKFTTEINEVLPRNAPPVKFRQASTNSNSVVQLPQHIPKILPSVVLQQYQSPLITTQQQTPEVQYETSENISLKHFNEQQFLLQQQLIQKDKDKQRLQEQELQRQQEIQRHQNEAFAKQQDDLRIQKQQQEEIELKKIEQDSQWQQLRNQMDRQNNPRDKQYALQEQKEFEGQHSIEQQHKLPEVAIVPDSQVHEQDIYKYRQQLQQPQDIVIRIKNNLTQLQEQQQSEIPDDLKSEIPLHRLKKPLHGQYRGQRPTTPIYDVQLTEFLTQDMKKDQIFEEVAVQTTFAPEETFSTTVRHKIRRPGMPLRKRRPITTTLEPETVASASSEEEMLKYEKSKVNFTEEVQVKPFESAHEVSTKRRPVIRKRPGYRPRIHLGEPFEAEVVTEVIESSKIASRNTTKWENYPENYKKPLQETIDSTLTPTQAIYTQTTEEELTENSPKVTYSVENTMSEEQVPVESLYGDRIKLQNNNANMNIPLESLFNKPKENQIDVDTITMPNTTSTTTPTMTSEASITTTKATSTTRSSHRIRPLRFGNVTRPRFSIKNYKGRLDYKNRLMHISTTETSHASSQNKTKFPTNSRPQETLGNSTRETTGRYKYMSRISYKTTTSTPPVNRKQAKDDMTTENINKFTPKRKLYNGHLYRSRITNTTDYSNKSENSAITKHDTVRPDNIFSSSIRQRPHLKSKIKIPEEMKDDKEEPTEMTAEETSFYFAATTPRLTENINEIIDEKEVTQLGQTEEKDAVKDNEKQVTFVEEDQKEPTEPFLEADVTQQTRNEMEEQEMEEKEEKENNENSSEVRDVQSAIVYQTESSTEVDTTATNPGYKDLFATASQSVADLTSSASALYDKPGMFMAISPVTKNRVISPHFKIAIDKPTLPIETFFQELSKKE